jgi:hypothetical protein
MLCFKSLGDIERAAPPQPVTELLRSHWSAYMRELDQTGGDYNPDADGYFVYFGAEEALQALLTLLEAESLDQVIVEFVEFHPETQLYRAVYLVGADFGLALYFLDTPYLNPKLREWLQEQPAP